MRGSVAALLLSVGLQVGVAKAQSPAPVALNWTRLPGAETCPNAREVAEATNALTGRVAFVRPSDARIFVEARVARARRGFHATLVITDDDGTPVGSREITSADGSCGSILTPVALVLSVLITPGEAQEVGAPAGATTAPSASAPTPPAPPVVAAPTPTPTPTSTPTSTPALVDAPQTDTPQASGLPAASARRPWRGQLLLALASNIGLLPRLAFGASLGASLTPPGFVPFELHVAGFLPSPARFASGSGADVSLYYAEVNLCPVDAQLARVDVRVCLGTQLGILRSQSVGLVESSTGTYPVWNAQALLRIGFRVIPRVATFAALGIVLPFARQELVARSSAGVVRNLHTFATLAIGLQIGVRGDFL